MVPFRARCASVALLLTASTLVPSPAAAQTGVPAAAPSAAPTAPSASASAPAAAPAAAPGAAAAAPATPPTTAPAPSAQGGPAAISAEGRAEQLFREGRAHMELRQFAEACVKFEEARRLLPEAVGALLNLGACNRAQRKYVTAQRFFRDALERLRVTPDDRLALTQRNLEEIEPNISTLRLRVEADDVPGLRVELDGVALDPSRWNALLLVDGGRHVVHASAPQRKPVELEIIVDYERARAELVVPKLETIPDTRISGFVIGGLGVAALATGVAVGASVVADCGGFGKSKCDSLDGKPAADFEREKDRLNTQAWLANVTVGLGVIGVGIGTYLVVTAPKRKAEAAVRFVPWAGAQGGGGVLAGRF